MHEMPGTPRFTPRTETTHTPPPPSSMDPVKPTITAETATAAATDTAIAAPFAAPTPTLPPQIDRRQEIFRVAGELYRQTPDWVMFFREILGVDGIVRKMFTKPEELAVFEKTAEYEDILHMLSKLRERTAAQIDDNEPTRVITVRLPKSLHESLKVEAHDRRTSMNKLCISKLLQALAEELAAAAAE
jgi:predicted HicB family RNase H-like nuclease